MTTKRVIDLPRVMSVEHDKGVTPFVGVNPKVAEQIHNFALRGVVTKEGKFHIDPGGMKIEKTQPGLYKVIHSLGYFNTSINVSIIDPPGGAKIVEHHPMYFIVETSQDGEPVDKDWMFSLMKTL